MRCDTKITLTSGQIIAGFQTLLIYSRVLWWFEDYICSIVIQGSALCKGQEKSRKSRRIKQTQCLQSFWIQVGIQWLHHAAALLPLLSLLCLLSLEKCSSFIVSLWWSIVSKRTVAKRHQKCHHSSAEELPRASMSAFFPPFLWRGCGCETQSLECCYTTQSKIFQCWVPQVPMYGLTENSPIRVSLWEQA